MMQLSYWPDAFPTALSPSNLDCICITMFVRRLTEKFGKAVPCWVLCTTVDLHAHISSFTKKCSPTESDSLQRPFRRHPQHPIFHSAMSGWILSSTSEDVAGHHMPWLDASCRNIGAGRLQQIQSSNAHRPCLPTTHQAGIIIIVQCK